MIKPNVLIKHEKGAPLLVDVNLAVSYMNRFEVGTGYRSDSSVNLLAGIYLFDNVRAIYNYNVSFNDSTLGSTHGFILRFQLGDGYAIRKCILHYSDCLLNKKNQSPFDTLVQNRNC